MFEMVPIQRLYANLLDPEYYHEGAPSRATRMTEVSVGPARLVWIIAMKNKAESPEQITQSGSLLNWLPMDYRCFQTLTENGCSVQF